MDCSTFRAVVEQTFEPGSNVEPLDFMTDAVCSHKADCPECAAWFEDRHEQAARDEVAHLVIAAILSDCPPTWKGK
jgi:predicted anti-sigma-YlaC factor YlaD